MTTVFGIKHPKIEAAVLVADRQTTTMNGQTGFPMGKYLGRKLWICKEGVYCFGHSGLRDNETEDFAQGLAQGNFDVLKIIKKGYFPELRKLNIKRMGKENPDLNKLSSFLLATRFDGKPKLYTCFPLGSVQERVWTAVGSGYPRIKEYMDAMQIFTEARDYLNNGKDPTIADAIRVGLEAVRRSQSQDLYSHGLDMLVCTPEEINDHSTELGDDFEKKLGRIQRRYGK
jgi:hypothetical protein